MLHPVGPSCSFTGVSPSSPAHRPLRRTPVSLGAPGPLAEHLHALGAAWCRKQRAGCLCPLGVRVQLVQRPCCHTVSCLSACLSVWSPFPWHSVSGRVQQPLTPSAASGLLCCSPLTAPSVRTCSASRCSGTLCCGSCTVLSSRASQIQKHGGSSVWAWRQGRGLCFPGLWCRMGIVIQCSHSSLLALHACAHIPGDVPGQAGQGSEQADRVAGVPARCRDVGLGDL